MIETLYDLMKEGWMGVGETTEAETDKCII